MRRLTEAWFRFKGIDSRDMGIWLKQMPVRYLPGRNITRKHAAGVDGTYAYGDGTYNDAKVQMECDLRDETKMAEVAAWLTGSGELVFSDEPNLAYDASIDREFSRASITPKLTGQRFTVMWICHPFRRMIPEAAPIVMTAPGEIRNPGTIYSQPKITVIGRGDFSLTINMQTMFFTGIEGGIVLDCKLMDAFDTAEAIMINDRVYGEFFRLQPGVNYLSWILEEGAAIQSITIEPRWRCI